MDCSRAAMLEVHTKAVDRVGKGLRGASEDQVCMFEAAEIAPAKPEIPDLEDEQRQSLEWEKETLGLYVSDHPLRPVLHKLKKHIDTTVSDLDNCRDGAMVWVGGLATSVRINTTRKGDNMAMLQLDDMRGLAEVMVFPRVYANCSDCVREDAVLKVKGRVERKEGFTAHRGDGASGTTPGAGSGPTHTSLLRRVRWPLPRRRGARPWFSVIRDHPGGSSATTRIE